MGKEEVLSKEQGTFIDLDEQGDFYLKSSFAGEACFIKYYFYKDLGLIAVDVIYELNPSFSMFETLFTMLKIKYGTPEKLEDSLMWIVSERTWVMLDTEDFRFDAILSYVSVEYYLKYLADSLDEL
jgi:hypothetical protein